jgi:hypothetical protein
MRTAQRVLARSFVFVGALFALGGCTVISDFGGYQIDDVGSPMGDGGIEDLGVDLGVDAGGPDCEDMPLIPFSGSFCSAETIACLVGCASDSADCIFSCVNLDPSADCSSCVTINIFACVNDDDAEVEASFQTLSCCGQTYCGGLSDSSCTDTYCSAEYSDYLRRATESAAFGRCSDAWGQCI